MPLLLADLDDTLIDRRGSFRAWAESFCAREGIDAGAVGWLVELDAYGYTPREEVFTRIRERFLLAEPVDELVAAYRDEYPSFALRPSDETFAQLEALRARGWRIGVVTNGHPIQLRKLETVGLDVFVDACCVSEIEGVRKPDPAIFERAAALCDEPLAGGWMIGDNPEADIGGAHALGLSTIWLRHQRTWAERAFSPTLAADTLEEALAHLAGLP